MEVRKKALAGVVVLDLTQFLSGPFCTMLLSDLGAEVIKVERPDRPKASGPYLNGERTYDLSVNRGKKSITFNLKNEWDKSLFLKLVEKADVLVENFKPGTMDKMGLGYGVIKEINPSIIYASISGFGHTGPYANRGALDMVIQGISGFMSLTGEQNGRPIKAGPSISDLIAGIYTFGAITTALYYREHSKTGQFIDVAMLDCMFSCLENAVINYYATGQIPTRNGNRHQTISPFQSFQASDGEVIITASRDSAYAKLCKTINREDLITDPRFCTPEKRRQNTDELEKEITIFTSKHTVDEIETLLVIAGVPFGRINTVAQISNDPQIAARGMVEETVQSVAGPYKMAGNPLKFSETPPVANRPAPLLGEHTYEILCGMLEMTDQEIEDFLRAQKGSIGGI